MKVGEAFDEITDSEDDQELNWFQPVRRPSFSELLQERFLLALSDSEDLPKKDCQNLIDEGLLIEENQDNLKYLLKNGLVKRETEY